MSDRDRYGNIVESVLAAWQPRYPSLDSDTAAAIANAVIRAWIAETGVEGVLQKVISADKFVGSDPQEELDVWRHVAKEAKPVLARIKGAKEAIGGFPSEGPI